ncbi:MAG: BMP family ABC transporter substrate-binding protein [Chloroflexi bacterium]|nr:BMP family ABC transporter substrate-binding protein [Chloroflexota bacterium]
MLIAIVALAACGSDDPTAVPVQPQPTAAQVPAGYGSYDPTTVTATSPSMADLHGGSPEVFLKGFEDAIAGSKFRSTSEFAAAAQPLAAGEKLKVGFIFVGSQKDLGYNQAAAEGSQYLERVFDDIEVLRSENIPETADVQAVEEQMIRDGAKIIFATSYGYSGPTKEIIEKHPDVMFLHMGDVEAFENYASFFGNIWQLEYAAGQVAGNTSKTGKLGFIAAFPIPQTLLNVNAFHLGAQSVNPDIKTTFVLTSSWCDPAKQATAVKAMVDAGVDVLTQHQDCTKTIVEAAERAGIFVTGYHQDASPAAPNAWLTGAAWNWGPVYAEIVAEIRKGTYKSSVMFQGLDAGWVQLSPFGDFVPDDVKQSALDTVERLRTGSFQPFTGPITDQDGVVQIAAGVVPTDADLQSTGYLLQGITGRTN